jgi:hypothetical protein
VDVHFYMDCGIVILVFANLIQGFISWGGYKKAMLYMGRMVDDHEDRIRALEGRPKLKRRLVGEED